MLENIIYALPELLLICGLIILPIMHLFQSHHRKILKTCAIFMLLSAFMEIIFYNKSFASHYLNDTAFNTMMNMIVYASSLAVLLLAKRWYISTGESPFIFCESLLLTLLCGDIMTASTHFAVTVATFWGMLSINFTLLNHSAKIKENLNGLQFYKYTALFFSLAMLAVALIFYLENGHLAYSSLASFIDTNSYSSEAFLLMFVIFTGFIFLFGLTPFNFWHSETLGQVILPVLSYFLLVPFAAYFCAFINLRINVFAPISFSAANLCMIFAVVSIFVGALGTCTGKNIYKLFAYGSLFHTGIMLLALSDITIESIDTFMIYLLTYQIAMFGIFGAFFGLRSRGEYLLMLPDIAGSASKKPYISAMISVYLFSLIGFPPFLGFVGLYSIGYNLAMNNHLYLLMFLLAATIIITYGYIQIIKSLYFEKSKNIFDHAEREIYAVMLITAVLMTMTSLKPDILIENIKDITERFFG